MDRVSESHDWMLNLGFALVVVGGESDEITVGSVWGPGIIESLRFSRNVGGVEIRAYILPGRVPVREGLGSGLLIVAEKVLDGASDIASMARQASVVGQTVEDVEIRIGRVVPWEAWSLMVRVENLDAAARELYGNFVIRVLGHSILPVPAFWERGVAPHLVRSASRDRDSLVQ